MRIWQKMNVILHRDDRIPAPEMWIFATVRVVAIECIVCVDARRVYLHGRNMLHCLLVSLPENLVVHPGSNASSSKARCETQA